MMRLAAPEGLDPVDVPLDERVEIVRTQSFAFDTRSDQTQDWPVAVGVDASTWSTALLVVLVHQINTWDVGTQLEVAVDAIALDSDDPRQVFLGSTVASVILSDSTEAGTSQIASLTPPWGKHLRVAVRPLQRTIEATAEQLCTLTILLVGRRQGIVGAPHLLMQRANER